MKKLVLLACLASMSSFGAEEMLEKETLELRKARVSLSCYKGKLEKASLNFITANVVGSHNLTSHIGVKIVDEREVVANGHYIGSLAEDTSETCQKHDSIPKTEIYQLPLNDELEVSKIRSFESCRESGSMKLRGKEIQVVHRKGDISEALGASSPNDVKKSASFMCNLSYAPQFIGAAVELAVRFPIALVMGTDAERVEKEKLRKSSEKSGGPYSKENFFPKRTKSNAEVMIGQDLENFVEKIKSYSFID